MPSAARSFIAIVAGMVIAVTCVSAFDLIAGTFHPVPPGFDPTNWEQVRAHAANAPTPALVIVLLGWMVGSFAGGLVSSRIAERKRRGYAYIISTLILAATISNFFTVPHPAWMMLSAVTGIVLSGMLAARLAPADSAA